MRVQLLAPCTQEGLNGLFIAFPFRLLDSDVIGRNMNLGHSIILLMVPRYHFVVSDFCILGSLKARHIFRRTGSLFP